MCLQCDTQAEIILVDVLPGYNLMRAHVGAARWPEGWYALVQGNDPALVFQAWRSTRRSSRTASCLLSWSKPAMTS